ncbi:MAG: hypothetical protein HY866_23865, partial [Chloroflexi bacterium]|nr:hypothetical protein [Chloroflexota bacterium]
MPDFTSRPPRIQPELPYGEVDIPNPPSEDIAGRQQMAQMFLPMVTIIGYVFVSAAGSGRSMLLLIPMGLSVVASTTMALWNFRITRKAEREKKRIYMQRLAQMRKDMVASQDLQRRYYLYNYPGPDPVLKIAGDRQNRNSGLRLWERRTTDSDFGAIRLGIGTRHSTMIYKVSSMSGNEETHELQEALKLYQDSLYVSDVPITIPLRSYIKPQGTAIGSITKEKTPSPADESIEARFALGIAGKAPAKTYDFIRSILAHYTVFHAPTDARLYVVGAPAARPQWDWARWLPHCNTSRQQGTGDLLCFDADKVRRFWDELQTELERRQLRLADKDNQTDPTLPHLLVVVDGLTAQGEDSPLNAVQAEAAVSLLLQRGTDLGTTIIFLVPERSMVPSECQAIIEIEPVEEGVAFRYAEVGINTPRYVGEADQLITTRAETEFARRLAPLAVRTTYGADLATAVTLIEMLAANTVEEIPILSQWEKTRKPENS